MYRVWLAELYRAPRRSRDFFHQCNPFIVIGRGVSPATTQHLNRLAISGCIAEGFLCKCCGSGGQRGDSLHLPTLGGGGFKNRVPLPKPFLSRYFHTTITAFLQRGLPMLESRTLANSGLWTRRWLDSGAEIGPETYALCVKCLCLLNYPTLSPEPRPSKAKIHDLSAHAWRAVPTARQGRSGSFSTWL